MLKLDLINLCHNNCLKRNGLEVWLQLRLVQENPSPGASKMRNWKQSDN
jgi:hypothetical protein